MVSGAGSITYYYYILVVAQLNCHIPKEWGILQVCTCTLYLDKAKNQEVSKSKQGPGNILFCQKNMTLKKKMLFQHTYISVKFLCKTGWLVV